MRLPLRLMGCCLMLLLAQRVAAIQQKATEPARSTPVSTWISGDQQIWCFQFPLTEESPSGVFLVTDRETESVTVDEALANGVGYNGLPLLRRMLMRAGTEAFEPGPAATLVWSAANSPFRSDRSFSLDDLADTEPAAIPPGGWKLHGKGDVSIALKIGGQRESTACLLFPMVNWAPEVDDWLIGGRFFNSIEDAAALAARYGQQLWPIPAGEEAAPTVAILVGFSPDEIEQLTPEDGDEPTAPESDSEN